MNIRKSILIADDSELNRSILQEFFCQQYDTFLAEDGEQATLALEQRSDEIALILLDLVMPGKTGFEVLQYMNDHHMIKRIPVIVITGSNDYQDELKAYNLGAADIIHKPFVPEIVLRRAENVIELFTHRIVMEQQLERSQQELEDAHTYDSLTGLYNMQYFLAKADERLQKADERGQSTEYAFLYGNIRNFKFHNLSKGVKDGDRVLKILASRIQTLTPTNTIHSRFGNDHIVSMIPYAECMDKAETLVEMFNQEFGNTNLKMKVGIYHVTAKGEKAAAACDFAKVACDTIYNSKESVCIYTDRIASRIRISNYVESHLDEAIRNGYIHVYYQPVIRTISGALCGMEALARWIDPVMGFLSPGDFVPVLERQHLITKLDLHMLRLICRDMKEAEEKHLKIIPVSFNLSRIDLLECDILTEVEAIIKEYSIPRDMINIEITESTITQNPEYMRQIIDSFRQAGYQVWMDDFGSEYSSLNSLKDYQFDEIKLDMKFLSRFDDTCKKIIRSVIRMAKELGIQTLAEGVETKEQLEFLREVGCEKAQGYYFSKPVPIEEMLEISRKTGDHVEERVWRGYYNNIGMINFITERSLAIVEFDGKEFNYLFVNDAYKKVWAGLGTVDMGVINQVTNSRTSPLGKQLRARQKTLHRGEGSQDFIAPAAGKYIRLTVRCLAEYGNHGCYAAEITNLSSREEEEKYKKMDTVYRDMYAMYDAIYTMDLNTGKFQTLMQGSSNRSEEYKKFHSMDEPDMMMAARVFIYPTEREEFERFVDLTTLKDRLKESGRGYLVHYFRSVNGQGGYNWMIHTILYVPNGNYVVYAVRSAFLNQKGLVEQLAPEYLANTITEDNKNIHHVLRKAIMESKAVNLFWKDKNRRFINVNENFLATYGFKDASAVIGKTDEEMGWHVDAEPFMDDELDVLEKGKVIVNRIGHCIIRGVNHTIIASKEPMYDEGEIVGLVGIFIIADEIGGLEDLVAAHIVDQTTNLMTVAGLTDEVSHFVEGWHARQENFAVIRINLPEYFRLSRTYSERIAKDMIHEVGKMIAETFSVHGVCARLFGGNFSALMQCHGRKKDVQQICRVLHKQLSEIHELLGYPVTFNPKVEISFADETENMKEIIGLALGGTVVDVAERKKLEEQLNTYDLQLNTVVNAIPGGIVLYEMMPDDTHQVVYASPGIGKLSGRTEEEFRKDSSGGDSIGMYEKDTEIIHNAIMETVHHAAPLNVSYRVWHKNGSLIWINVQGRVIGEQNEHPLLLTVFQNVSEATTSYEDALNEAMVGVVVHSTESDDTFYENEFARNMVDTYFDGSYVVLQQEVIADIVRQGLEPSEETGEFQVECRGKNLRVRISDQLWNGRSAKVIYLMDITAKVQEEQSVKELVHNIPATIFVFSMSREGTFHTVYLSDSSKMLTDLDRLKDNSMESMMTLVPKEDHPLCKDVLQQAIRTGRPAFTEHRVIGRNGKYVWVRLSISAQQQVDGSNLFFAVYTDITEQKRQEQQSIQNVLPNIPATLIVFSQPKDGGDYELIYLSRTEYLNVDTSVRGHSNFDEIMSYVPEEDRYICLEAFAQARQAQKPVFAEYRVYSSEEETIWVRLTLSAKEQEDGSFWFFGVYTDITEQKKLEQIDEFGTLPRSAAIRQFMRILNRKKGGYSMLILDVDDLKRINDTFGHPVGDFALYSVVRVLHSVFRKSDIVGRLGGDEYMVFLNGLADRKKLEEKLSLVLEKLGRVRFEDCPDFSFHCSVGAVTVRNGSYAFEELYKEADKALYEAKRNGKNGYVIKDKTI